MKVKDLLEGMNNRAMDSLFQDGIRKLYDIQFLDSLWSIPYILFFLTNKYSFITIIRRSSRALSYDIR